MKTVRKGWGMALVVEYLPSKHEALSSNCDTSPLPKKKKRKKKETWKVIYQEIAALPLHSWEV
jgi:hypothetical protein